MQMGIKERSGDLIRFIVYLVVVVLINAAGMTLFFRVDLTSNGIYSLSRASKEVVSTLSEPLTVNAFFTKNLPAPYNNTERYLRDLLQEYAVYANNYFNYRFYDVSSEDIEGYQGTGTNQALARSYGISPVQIQHIEKDELKFKTAYMGLVMIHGDMIEPIPTIASTNRLEYRFTTAIQRLNNKIGAFLGLEDKIKIRLFLSSSLEAVAPYIPLEGLSQLPEEIEGIVNELNTRCYGKLEFQYVDPSKEQDIEKQIERYDILSLEWPDLREKNIKSGKGYAGLIMEHGDKSMSIPLIQVYRLPFVGTHYELTDVDVLDESINNSLESLLNINEDIGYLADHGSPALWGGISELQGVQDQESLSNFNRLVSGTYNIKEILLSEEEIPEGLDCLVIAGATVEFTDYELFQIDQFVMKGNNLALFLDVLVADESVSNVSLNQGSMFVSLDTGLENLLKHYGVSIKRSLVMDENCHKQELSQTYGGGELDIYFIPYIKDRFINKELPFMNNIKGLVVSKISPLELNQERIQTQDIKAQRLFSSSERSWEMKDSINLNPLAISPPSQDSEFGSMPLAYILEGEFTSYFADKPIPEKESKEEEESPETDEQEPLEEKPELDLSGIKSEGALLSRGKPGKIFLMGSSEILKDYILDSQGTSTNATFILNLIDYLNNREQTAIMRAKETTFNPLMELSGQAKSTVKYFNIVGLPLLAVFFGLFVWFRRHSRKQKIRGMFSR